MRKFLVSDIHGDGNIYYSIMSYLDNISKNENIELYINGDLFDRGIESAEILLDIKKRIEENKFRIVYLGGNHELLMYHTFLDRKNSIRKYCNSWYDNGGYITDWGLEELLNYDRDKILEVVDFIANLNIYHQFDERIDDKNIVLVHASCPLEVKNVCDISIKDNNDSVYSYVWTREHDPFIPFRGRIGNDDYFTIVGHTPNHHLYGYEYHENGNYFNIDGGCACYVSGLFHYDHVPLVEVMDGYLRILTFNHNNEIIYGNYFIHGKNISFSDKELSVERSYLNHHLKVRKLVLLEDGIVGYKD